MEKIKRQDIIIGILIILLLSIRLCMLVGMYDEVFNINISFQTILGKRHLVENTAFFQTGDLFNMPFLALYYMLHGDLNGIVVFLRFCYMLMNFCLGFAFYRIFHKALGKRTAFLCGVFIVTIVHHMIYNIWYDSMGLYFMLLGMLFLYACFHESDKGRKWLFGIGAGISHGCMTYAYPTMLLVIVFVVCSVSICQIWKEKIQKKTVLLSWIPYLAGGMIVVTIFIGYICYQGPGNIFLFQDGGITGGLNGRILGTIMEEAPAEIEAGAAEISDACVAQAADIVQEPSKIQAVLDNLWGMLWKNCSFLRHALVLMPFLLIMYALGLKKYIWLRKYLFGAVLLIGLAESIRDGQDANSILLTFYLIWAPFWYFYLPDNRKKLGGFLLALMWIPCIAAWLVIGFTAMYEEKCSMGSYTGGLVSIMLMLLCLEKEWYKRGLVYLAILANLVVFYNNDIEGGRPELARYRINTGIYQGIYAEEKSLKYEEVQKKTQNIVQEKDIKTAWCSKDYTSCYLWLEALQTGVYFPEELQKEEREIFLDSIADVVVVDDRDMEKMQWSREGFEPYYDLIYDDYDVSVYLKKGL